MQLMNELVDAFLDNSFEHLYYLDLQTGQVILNLDDTYTGEPGIDRDDEKNDERYICVPKITSNEAYLLMEKFAKRTDTDPEMKLFDALNRNKPFRRFKDALYELDAWDEWNQFECQYAKEKIETWLGEFEFSYEQLIKERFA